MGAFVCLFIYLSVCLPVVAITLTVMTRARILILRIRIFLEFFLENSKNKYFWYSLNFYS